MTRRLAATTLLSVALRAAPSSAGQVTTLLHLCKVNCAAQLAACPTRRCQRDLIARCRQEGYDFCEPICSTPTTTTTTTVTSTTAPSSSCATNPAGGPS